jgi:AAHS family 4-hydroxybenzoate transporter-like MFS transporter
MSNPIDDPQAIQSQGPGWFTIRLVLLSALVTFIDGYDLNVVAYAAPYFAPVFHLDKIMVGHVFSSGILGTLLGGLTFGPAADRIGRRSCILFATVSFGVLTLALAAARNYEQLMLLRFINGVALGGAIPLVWAYGTEFVPKRYRATVVTLIMLGYGLGVGVSGPLSVALIPRFGWSSVFWAGGALGLLVTLLLYRALPESARFLALRGQQPERVQRYSIKPLFTGELRTITPLLWIAYIASSMSTFFLTFWGPQVYEGLGYARSSAAWLMSMNAIAAGIGAVTLMRFTDRVGVISVAVFPGLAVPLLIIAGYAHIGQVELAFLVALLNVFLGGSHYGITSTVGTFYPTAYRATGAGWAASMAKLGSIAGPWIGGYVLSSTLPLQRTFAVMAICPAVLSVCLCAISLAQRDAMRRTSGSLALPAWASRL